MHEYYSPPQACPPFGLIDEIAVVGTPKDLRHNINSKKVTLRRDLPTSNKAVLGKYLRQINWPLLFTPLVSCEEKWQVFQEIIHSGLEIIMPAKQVKICKAEVPWMNETLIKEAKGVQQLRPRQLSVHTFVALSTERGKPEEGNTASERSKT